MENPCLRCHTCAVVLSRGGAIIQLWRFASRAALGMVRCNECRRGRVMESNEVVFQFNDLQLRRGCSQREFQNAFTDLSAEEKCEATICNLGDLIPEVVGTSTCTCRLLRSQREFRKFDRPELFLNQNAIQETNIVCAIAKQIGGVPGRSSTCPSSWACAC
jgi:hypothetical protein